MDQRKKTRVLEWQAGGCFRQNKTMSTETGQIKDKGRRV